LLFASASEGGNAKAKVGRDAQADGEKAASGHDAAPTLEQAEGKEEENEGDNEEKEEKQEKEVAAKPKSGRGRKPRSQSLPGPTPQASLDSPVPPLHLIAECIPPYVNLQKPLAELNPKTCMTKDGKYVCPECKAIYNSKNGFTIHYRVHTGDRPFACPACGESFTSKQHLNYHVKTRHKTD